MATPTSSEIREKALELWHLGLPVSDVTPTDEELRENGVWREATIALMRSKTQKVPKSLMASQSESEDRLKRISDLEDFPISQIMREGCFVVGGRGCGKSNLLKVLVDRMLLCGIQVKVIDSTLSWKNYPLPKTRVKKNTDILAKWNSVFDISRLGVLEMRQFVSLMMSKDLETAIMLTDNGVKFECCYILEESQNLVMPSSLRSLKYQNISRYCTQGRNFHLSYVASTQRLASVDTNLVEISGVKFWFRLDGENNLRKARSWLSKTNVYMLRDLDVGICFQQIGSSAEIVRVPLWSNKPLTVKNEVSSYALKA